jgi:ribosomal protein L30E
MKLEKELRDAIKENRAVLGMKSVIRGIKSGKVATVIHASNTPGSAIRDLNHYTAASGLAVKSFEGNSHQLGETCGKPFSIIMVGIRK